MRLFCKKIYTSTNKTVINICTSWTIKDTPSIFKIIYNFHIEDLMFKINGARNKLAFFIIGSCFAIILLITLTLLFSNTKSTELKDITGMILPVLGTWVGAVITFYFSRDNFEVATNATKELITIDKKLNEIKVHDVMIDYFSIEKSIHTINMDSFLKLGVLIVLNDMKRNRLPVFDDGKRVISIIHKSTITEFITSQISKNKDINTMTFNDFKILSPDLFNKILAFSFVSSNESLAKAKRIMENHSTDCADIFVTTNGTKEEQVLGWITNVDISHRSRA